MIIKRQNMSENKWNHFKIVPMLTQSLSTVNCQFGEAGKFQFIEPWNDTERVRAEAITDQVRHDLSAATRRQIPIYLSVALGGYLYFYYTALFRKVNPDLNGSV